MKPFFNLLFNYQIKSWLNLIISFLIPIIALIISTSISNLVNQPFSSNGFYLSLPGIIISIAPTIGIVNLSLTLNDFKQSLFLKRLKAMTINKWDFLFAIIFYYIINILIFSLIFIIICCAIFYQKINFSWINWVWIFIAVILNSILCCLLTFIVNYWINDFKISLIISILLFLIIVLLSGDYLPLYIIKTNKLLKIIAYIIPNTYITGIMIYGWYGFPPTYNHNNLFNSSDYSIFNGVQIPLIISIAWIFLLITIIILEPKIKKFFKFNLKKVSTYIWKK